MTLVRIEMVLRLVGGVIAALAVAEVERSALTPMPSFLAPWPYLLTVIIGTGAVAAFVLAFALTPALTTRPFFWALARTTEMPASDVLAAAVGAVLGLLVGVLVAIPLSYLPWYLGSFLPIGASLALAYLGVTAMLAHKKELLPLVPGSKMKDEPAPVATDSVRPCVVDTSSIIDGRIADIGLTGFIPGPLLVPRFVLRELQHIADSADAMRRARGRRGLDILNKLQKDATVPLVIHEDDGEPGIEVDALLVQLARKLNCPIITNDYNLNRVAGLQGVRVLNVNELANAVKSIVLPGQEMSIKVIQEGKEVGQGVGYLEDGTMVVVENGRRGLGTTATVVVSRVLQTAAGRMVFAHLRSAGANEPPARDGTNG
ncbi:MAG: PIN domain nuclease [Chloroflexi bacterium]|nr:PIN domain nuclease [Chloroflexota bacterium]